MIHASFAFVSILASKITIYVKQIQYCLLSCLTLASAAKSCWLNSLHLPPCSDASSKPDASTRPTLSPVHQPGGVHHPTPQRREELGVPVGADVLERHAAEGVGPNSQVQDTQTDYFRLISETKTCRRPGISPLLLNKLRRSAAGGAGETMSSLLTTWPTSLKSTTRTTSRPGRRSWSGRPCTQGEFTLAAPWRLTFSLHQSATKSRFKNFIHHRGSCANSANQSNTKSSEILWTQIVTKEL